MADVFSKEKRSDIMSRIRRKNTKPELAVRSLLHRLGFRFTVNGAKNRSLPGKPDIVLLKYRTVIFVHGCFWHRHEDCKFSYTPKTRVAFWTRKFESNVVRDKAANRALRDLGWKVITVWECQINREPEKLALQLEHLLRGQ
ncbi:MAG: DNA mismatch endonuclease Vsr [Verrucomicrobiae bacterium]|nr:DNA mismatch endonuclease Vsr [Verrucomicrobiae bacterium]